MKLKVLIIDDEKRAREGLFSQLESKSDQIELVGEASSVQEGLQRIRQLEPDLVFLDVEMGDGTGFDLLKEIGSPDFQLVFVTAFDQYAIQAIKFSALDYLLKPIDPDELSAVVDKAFERALSGGAGGNVNDIKNFIRNEGINNPNDRKIGIKCLDSIKYLPISELSHFSADGSYTKIFMKDGKAILASKMLKHFVEMLEGYTQFVRIHRSTLINIKFVEEFQYSEGGSVLMTNGLKVYPSEDRKKELLHELEKLS